MHEANMSRKTSFMLHWALLALRRQRGESERSDKLRAAYRAGLRNWKRIYLRRQLAAARRERTGAAVGDFLKVALAASAELKSVSPSDTRRDGSPGGGHDRSVSRSVTSARWARRTRSWK